MENHQRPPRPGHTAPQLARPDCTGATGRATNPVSRAGGNPEYADLCRDPSFLGRTGICGFPAARRSAIIACALDGPRLRDGEGEPTSRAFLRRLTEGELQEAKCRDSIGPAHTVGEM
jgi:hypothetical protein